VNVVEIQQTVLPGMPEDVRRYLGKRCQEQGLKLLTGRSLQTFDGTNAELSDGTRFKDVFVCWATGARSGLEVDGEHDRIRDGRIIVDRCLRVPQHPEVYAVGDAAAMDFGNGPLRRAVNFALYSGRHAGRNIVRAMNSAQPKPWTPRDLGWVVPLCNAAAGRIMARFTVKGRFPLALHYFMCGYRSYNLGNRVHFMKMAAAALRAKR
jgi:NADH dehydrogenase